MTTTIVRNIVVDSCVLINFLNVDRCDLFGGNCGFIFHVTAHVTAEVTYDAQPNRLSTATASGYLFELPSGTHTELTTFATLTTTLGYGEAAAIAAAKHRSMCVALDDKAARAKAESLIGRNNVFTTTQLMVNFIQAQRLTVREADAIKREWASNYRFSLPEFDSFAEVISTTAA
jgi:predicted nucleic acid-binding protein